MATRVFIYLPVKDLKRSKAFFEGLGYSFNPHFTDENAVCMVIGDSIYAMLLAEPYFKTFTRKKLCNATKNTEVLIALDTASRLEVEQIINKARALGASIYSKPQDYGWMYQHNFADLDGHQWEFVYIDESQLPS